MSNASARGSFPFQTAKPLSGSGGRLIAARPGSVFVKRPLEPFKLPGDSQQERRFRFPGESPRLLATFIGFIARRKVKIFAHATPIKPAPVKGLRMNVVDLESTREASAKAAGAPSATLPFRRTSNI